MGVEAAGGEVTPLLNAEAETPAVRGRLGPSRARPGHKTQKGQGGFLLSDDTSTHSLSREQVSHCGGSPTLVGTAGGKSWKSTVPDHLRQTEMTSRETDIGALRRVILEGPLWIWAVSVGLAGSAGRGGKPQERTESSRPEPGLVSTSEQQLERSFSGINLAFDGSVLCVDSPLAGAEVREEQGCGWNLQGGQSSTS